MLGKEERTFLECVLSPTQNLKLIFIAFFATGWNSSDTVRQNSSVKKRIPSINPIKLKILLNYW